MRIFGPYEEVREFYPGTTRPNKPEMAKKTQELLAAGTEIICEAAFMDEDGNYCAADIIRWDKERKCYDLYEVKNSASVSEQFIKDAGFQAYLIREVGLNLNRVYIIFHAQEPYDIMDVTQKANNCAQWVSENIGRLGVVATQEEEVICNTGMQCSCPYECWYYSYCRDLECREVAH